MLTKHTVIYAAREPFPLECDIYESLDWKSPNNSPAILFFHAGGMVAGARQCVPPWLVQWCVSRGFPLLVPSYRLLPQAGADGILADTLDALRLASGHRPLPKEGSHEAMHQPRDVEATRRPVVAIGASSGFSLPVMAVQSLLKSLDRSLPLPAALVSFSGITTFQHPFFKSSTLLTPQPVTDEEVAQFVRPGEAVVGKVQPYDTMVFHTDMLDREGRKNASFTRPAKPEWPEGAEADREDKYWQARSMLYDYYLYKNEYPVMMADVDPGFEWAKDEANAERKKAWPPTIIIHGDKDVDVDLALATHMVECLGEDKVKLILAKNQEHMPGLTKFLEDDNGGMDAIRQSLSELDKILNVAKD